MTFRVVQKGATPVLVCYLVGSHMDAKLREACPGRAIVATDKSGLNTNGIELASALKMVGHTADAPIALCGYSAGCQGVRSLLLLGHKPTHVFAIDGTHASVPPAAWQIDVWRKLAEEAKRGERVFVGTCTNMQYVERIPVGQPGRAMSTRHVLEMATGATLEPPGTEVHAGSLHLHSYPSKDIDKEAHIAQQREVMPDMLRRYLGGAVDAKEASGESMFAAIGRRLAEAGKTIWASAVGLTLARPGLGVRSLAFAIAELGVRETHGPGNTKRVSEFLSVCVGRPERGAGAAGKRLGLVDDSNAWCAAFASWCMVQACNDGDGQLPHEPRAAVWELVADARERGTWRDVSTGYRPKPGDLGIYKRAGGDPRVKGQSGHVDRVETVGEHTMVCIGGNENDQVQRELQRLDAADLCGFIAYS